MGAARFWRERAMRDITVDTEHFDHLTRACATRGARRRLLAGTAGALLAALPLALRSQEAAARRKHRRKVKGSVTGCQLDSQCRRGYQCHGGVCTQANG